MGKPVITGTRITVELILEKLAANESIEQILVVHPRLTLEGIHTGFGYWLATGKELPTVGQISATTVEMINSKKAVCFHDESEMARGKNDE